MGRIIECVKCRTPLGSEVVFGSGLVPCPRCATLLQVEPFAALFREIGQGDVGEKLEAEGQSSCFYHPHKKAVVPCAMCGRFLCALCDVEFNGEHLCPGCLEAGSRKGKVQALENRRALPANNAFILSVLPTFLTGLIALYLAIRYWNAPRSLVQPTKVPMVAALIMASLQTLGFIIFFIYLFHH